MSDMTRNRLSVKWLLGICILAVVSIIACWLQFRPTEPMDSIQFPGRDSSKNGDPILVSPRVAGPEALVNGMTSTSHAKIREEILRSHGKVSAPLRTTVREIPIPFKSWQTAEGVQVHLPGGLETNVPQIELSFYLRKVGGEKAPFEVGIVGLREQGGRMLNNFAVNNGTALRLAVGRSTDSGEMLRIGDTYRVENVPIPCSFVVPDIPSGTVHRISLTVKDLDHEATEQMLKAAHDALKRNITIEILDYRLKGPDLEPFFLTYANDQVFISKPVTAHGDKYSVDGVRLGGELAINLRSSGQIWCYIRSVTATNVVFPGEDQLIVDPQALRNVTFEFEDPKQIENINALALYSDVHARVPLFWSSVERQGAAIIPAVKIQALPGVYDLRGLFQGVRGHSLPFGKILIRDSDMRIVLHQKQE